jgi:hypothetical protein
LPFWREAGGGGLGKGIRFYESVLEDERSDEGCVELSVGAGDVTNLEFERSIQIRYS